MAGARKKVLLGVTKEFLQQHLLRVRAITSENVHGWTF
jgi:hypothetical protein